MGVLRTPVEQSAGLLGSELLSLDVWGGNEWMEGGKATATENDSPVCSGIIPTQFLSFLLIIVSAMSAQLCSALLW